MWPHTRTRGCSSQTEVQSSKFTKVDFSDSSSRVSICTPNYSLHPVSKVARDTTACQRQSFWQNHTTKSQSPEQEAEDYFRVSFTIPLIDELIERLNNRFSNDQNCVGKDSF